MDEVCIECHGVWIDDWLVPPFVLRRGQCITLQLPSPIQLDHGRVISIFSGREATPQVALYGSSLPVEPASPPHGWRTWFFDATPFDWLKKNTMLPDDAVRSILAEFQMDGQIPLSQYAGTPRMVLGLHAALSKNPGAIIFETAGLDPRGTQQIYQIVHNNLAKCAALYLAGPIVSQGIEQYPVFPGSVGISVVEKSARSAVRIEV